MGNDTTTVATYFGHAGKLRKDRQLGGQQWLLAFENGYGASVITNPYSYGGDVGLFEVAVLHGADPKTAELCYATPVTNDVIGWLSAEAVEEHLTSIAALPEKSECGHQAVWA